MNKKLLLIYIILFFSITNLICQNIVINEFMAKNNYSIQDKDGDYSDWIELYNKSNTNINLFNYSLSDDEDSLNKWKFPNITIQAHSYLIIFASNKNILDTNELHTNFKISSDGEQLFLLNNSNVIADQTDSVQLSNNQVYCRIPDGNNIFIKTNISSPNASNNNSNQLYFSNPEGFYTSSFSLKITSIISDTIYYTLNGDVPTPNSNIYTDSIFINNKNNNPNVFSEIPTTTPDQSLINYKAWESPAETIDKATVLRCASFKNGKRTSYIYTKTYFVDDNMINKYSLPVISLITDKNNLFNSDTGIYVKGIHYNSNTPEWTGNYFMHSDDWERDIHIEYFTKNGQLCFSQNAGVRIHGGLTRNIAQKSLRLYARKKYGKAYFNHKLFPQKQINKYKRFILRTTMGDWGETIIKDVLVQDIAKNLDIESQDYNPVIVYINGEYWGIQTLRDRIDERFIEYTKNIDKDSVEFKQSKNSNYNNLISFIEDNSLANNDNYEYVKTQIDINNYIDYTISELFFSNYDWPVNNVKLWRKIPNGKWRWILYDIDAGFGDEDYNMLYHSTKNNTNITWPNSPSSTFLFRNLLKNELFKNKFINRYAEILNNEFDVNTMINKYYSIKDIYEQELPDNIERWNFPSSIDDWRNKISTKILSFIEKRPCTVANNIMEFFNLSNFNFSCKNKIYDIHKNTSFIVIAPNPNNGRIFLFNNSADINNATIFISDINGKIIYQENNIYLKSNERKYFKLQNLPSNTYILKLNSNNLITQKKVIIIH